MIGIESRRYYEQSTTYLARKNHVCDAVDVTVGGVFAVRYVWFILCSDSLRISYLDTGLEWQDKGVGCGLIYPLFVCRAPSREESAIRKGMEGI